MTREEFLYAIGQPFLHANFGYALTVHKAQGSEWHTVLVAMESVLKLRNEKDQRWLYTALTRAREKVIISMGGAGL